MELTPEQRLKKQCLLKYATPDGSETETLWNSRVGFVPTSMKSPQSGDVMQLVEVGDLVPSYVPEVGSRVITDMTEQRARVIAAQCLSDAMDAPESREEMQKLFESREEAQEMIYKTVRLCPFDVVTVTAGFIEELQEYRKGGTPINVSAGMIDPDPGPSETTERELHFDRKGKPISAERWMMLSEDRKYKVLERTEINADVHVSTIWLGLDHSFMGGKPVIFETMVFRRLPQPQKSIGGFVHEFDEDGCWRYHTEEEAFAGHKRTVDLELAKAARGAGRIRPGQN